MRFRYFSLVGFFVVFVGFFMNSVLVFCLGVALGMADDFLKMTSNYRSGDDGNLGVYADLFLLFLMILFFVGFLLKNEGLSSFVYRFIVFFIAFNFLILFFRVIKNGLKK